MEKTISLLINRSEITAGTRGSGLGPDAIRTAARSKKSTFFNEFNIVEINDQNQALDTPTTFLNARYVDAYTNVFKDVSSAVEAEIVSGNFPFVLAGDHGSGAATIAGIKKAFPTKRLGVIWIDAHGDLHTPYTTPSGNMHGMPLALALGEDNLECRVNQPLQKEVDYWNALKAEYDGKFLLPEDLVFIALRDTESQEDALINRLGIATYTVEEVRELGTDQLANQVLLEQLKQCDLIYVSFDVDSMDPQLTSFGTGTPVKNGLTPQESKDLLMAFSKDERLCCMECVEVNPCLDNQMNRMAELAFEIIESTVKVISNN
jgi:arginase